MKQMDFNAALIHENLRAIMDDEEAHERSRWKHLKHEAAPISLSCYVRGQSLDDILSDTALGVKGYLYSGASHTGAIVCYGNVVRYSSDLSIRDTAISMGVETGRLTRNLVKMLLRVADKIQRRGLDPRTMAYSGRSLRRRLP